MSWLDGLIDPEEVSRRVSEEAAAEEAAARDARRKDDSLWAAAAREVAGIPEALRRMRREPEVLKYRRFGGEIIGWVLTPRDRTASSGMTYVGADYRFLFVQLKTRSKGWASYVTEAVGSAREVTAKDAAKAMFPGGARALVSGDRGPTVVLSAIDQPNQYVPLGTYLQYWTEPATHPELDRLWNALP